MDRIKKYHKIIINLLEKEAAKKPDNMPQVQHQLIIDEKRQQYMLVAMGWNGSEYIHDWLFHIAIKEDKIWIYEDLTDPGIKVKLLKQKVVAEDIVLAYLPEYEQKEIVETPIAA